MTSPNVVKQNGNDYGIGIALSFVFLGLVLVWAPRYLELSSLGSIIFTILAFISAMIAAIGLLVELSKVLSIQHIFKNPGWSNFGIALFLLLVSLGLNKLSISVENFRTAFIALRIIVLVFLMIGSFAIGMAIEDFLLRREPRRQAPSKNEIRTDAKTWGALIIWFLTLMSLTLQIIANYMQIKT